MKKHRCFLLLCLLLLASRAEARWSWSLGYNNPPGSTLGVNFMHQWSRWAFELGVGGIQQRKGLDAAGEETRTTSVLGDMGFKYLTGSGSVRPYLEFGAGSAATVQTTTGADLSAGVGGLFGGVGLYAQGGSLNFYLGIISGGGNGAMTFGLGGSF